MGAVLGHRRYPQEQIPLSCRPNWFFVSTPKNQTHHLGSTQVTCDRSPGTQRTYHLLQNKYCWPNMFADVHQDISFCISSAQAKLPRTLPVGKLMLLPIPQQPWFHLAIGFLTDLPESQGNTAILVVIDCFSKSIHLIPIPTFHQSLPQWNFGKGCEHSLHPRNGLALWRSV